MTLAQLEYVVALSVHGHFGRAAEACGITQPTLSLMIQKLEEELEVSLFDRSSHPIQATEIGADVISKSKGILRSVMKLQSSVIDKKLEIVGDLNVAIIPTVAPYILPTFFKIFAKDCKNIKLNVFEQPTEVIIKKLLSGEIDMGILATPLNNPDLFEVPIYYEKFLVYVSKNEPLYTEKVLDPLKLPADRLWLLEEGHCLRGQIFNFCGIRQTRFFQDSTVNHPYYNANNIATLISVIDANGGYTIIPELHKPLLNKEQNKNIRCFITPEPVREVSLVIRHDFVKEGVLNLVAETLKKIIPESMIDEKMKKYAIRL